ncbi:hypothetical protein HDU93_004924, partial [Gonapodya sp. JEL0774]
RRRLAPCRCQHHRGCSPHCHHRCRRRHHGEGWQCWSWIQPIWCRCRTCRCCRSCVCSV